MTAGPPPPGKDELDTGRIRWLIRARMERFAACLQAPRFDPRGQRDGSLVQWFATFFPLLFTSDLQLPMYDLVARMHANPLHLAQRSPRLAPLYGALLALDDDDLWRGRLVALVNHHQAYVRASVYPALALVVDRFSFDDRRLQLRVEDCVRERYIDAEDAALLLLASRGPVPEKRRWAAAQLVRHAGHSRPVRALLEAAAEGRGMPNTLLHPLTRSALHVAVGLAEAGGLAPVPADATDIDLAHEFALEHGRELWPATLLHRMETHPFLQPTIDLDS